jgi:anti-sigma regulatory factor (Ser/Thr protein kinase)
MTGNGNNTNGERLDLQSRMSDLAQVPSWIERLASHHSIPANTQFAMNLCLEEVLSNIIRHGYVGRPDHSIGIRFTSPRENYFVLVVEDQAPPFNPVAAPELPPISGREDASVGGQGIRLLRRFADALEYQATPTGNRLTISFTASSSAIAGN